MLNVRALGVGGVRMSELKTVVGGRSRTGGSVIFVHGLGGSAFSTWGGSGTPTDPEFWPGWIGKDLPDLAVYSLSYPASPRQGRMSLHDIALNVLENLRNSPAILQSPIAFVCYSLGGLVIKQVLRLAHDRKDQDPACRKLIDNVSQVVFIATPHLGSTIAKVIKRGGWLARGYSLAAITLADDNQALPQLHKWYVNFCDPLQRQIENRVFFEKKATHGFMVVDEASASLILPRVTCTPVDADHVEIVKPRSPDVELYKSVKAMLSVLPSTREQVADEPKVAPTRRRPGGAAQGDLQPAAGGALAALAGMPRQLLAIMRDMLAFVPLPSWRWVAAGGTAVSLTALSLVGYNQIARGWSSAGSHGKAKAAVIAAPLPQDTSGTLVQRAALDDTRQLEEAAQAARRDAERNEAALRRAEEERKAALQALAVERRKAEEAERLRQLEAEKSAAAATIPQERDRARLQTIAARHPSLQPAVDARIAALAALENAEAKATTERRTWSIQDGLRRAGCLDERSSGAWTRATRDAVAHYNRQTGARLAVDRPTPQAEKALLAQKSRVCAADCGPGLQASNGACVAQAPACPGAGCEGAHVAWVGLRNTEDEASELFHSLQSAAPDAMSGKAIDVQRVDGRGPNAGYAVRVGPAASLAAVEAFCGRLRSAGVKSCWPKETR